MRKKIKVLIGLLIILTIGVILTYFLLKENVFFILGLLLIVCGLWMVIYLKKIKWIIYGYVLIFMGIVLLGIRILNLEEVKTNDTETLSTISKETVIVNLDNPTEEESNLNHSENVEIISNTEMVSSENIEIISNAEIISSENKKNETLLETNKLLSLKATVGVFDKAFHPDIHDYILTVPEKTTEVILEGDSYENMMITGLGKIEIIDLKTEVEISVFVKETSKANIYNITVIKNASTNTELESLTPSSGTIEYSNDILKYELRVKDNVSVISFDATPSDSDASVTGTELTALNYGENEIIITVTAEDGITKREIKVTVIREKELSKIIASEDNLILSIGEEKVVTYTLEPVETSYKEVEWISNDNSVVSVDATGKITGIGYGSTTVQIRSKHNPLIVATIQVNVISKEITSSIYAINREGETSYVIGIEPKTKLNTFIENFDNNPSTLYLYNEDEEEITGFEMYTGSYMKIKLIINETVYDELEIVVRGDLNGDGLVTVADYTINQNIISGIVPKTFILEKSADVNKDNNITVADLTLIKNYIFGKGSLN